MSHNLGEFGVICAVLCLGAILMTQEVASADSGGEGAGAGEQSADALARAVAETAGDPQNLERVSFTFVVEVDGEQKARRRHTWRPGDGKLRVEQGDEVIELSHVGQFDLSKMAESPGEFDDRWNKVAPEVSAKRAAEAWGWFINDSYWLFAPSKLLDPGVNRRLDDEGRLVLTFGDVGLTPGDKYVLTVDDDRDVVTRWSYKLQSGRQGTFRWRDYKEVGPLLVSTRRVSVGGDRDVVIRFEDVEVEE